MFCVLNELPFKVAFAIDLASDKMDTNVLLRGNSKQRGKGLALGSPQTPVRGIVLRRHPPHGLRSPRWADGTEPDNREYTWVCESRILLVRYNKIGVHCPATR